MNLLKRDFFPRTLEIGVSNPSNPAPWGVGGLSGGARDSGTRKKLQVGRTAKSSGHPRRYELARNRTRPLRQSARMAQGALLC